MKVHKVPVSLEVIMIRIHGYFELLLNDRLDLYMINILFLEVDPYSRTSVQLLS